MSIFSALFDSKTYSFEQAFGVKDITSSEMIAAIRSWFAIYFEGDSPRDENDCQRLPVAIVHKLTKAAFSEYETSIKRVGAKADFMTALTKRLDSIKKTAVQQALVGGECFIKPILTGAGFDFSVVRRDCFIPLARDTTGRITSVGTAEFTVQGGKYYTLMERRTVRADGALTIESKLYGSDSRACIGTQIGLDALNTYAVLQPIVTLPGIYNLGMIPVKTPMLNCVDGSYDGVSVYAPAVKLIQSINRNERQMDDEFENGASRIIASADMVMKGPDGRRKLPEKLFLALDEDPATVGMTVFSPALRESSFLARKTEYLRNIESLIGLKRGLLSEVEAAARTATEITSSQGDYSLTIQDFQEMWETAFRELLGTCDRLGQVYKLCDADEFDPDKELIVDWGDGILYDRTRTWQEYQSMVSSGMLKPELALAWYFNLPHDTLEDLQKIREDYMPEED
ncbi:MAG: putative portal protein [Oscillospiraceae bacterium]|nr:putative portal protein [Oscillospiraceae bacterium]